jgi:hypothetical protein
VLLKYRTSSIGMSPLQKIVPRLCRQPIANQLETPPITYLERKNNCERHEFQGGPSMGNATCIADATYSQLTLDCCLLPWAFGIHAPGFISRDDMFKRKNMSRFPVLHISEIEPRISIERTFVISFPLATILSSQSNSRRQKLLRSCSSLSLGFATSENISRSTLLPFRSSSLAIIINRKAIP